MPYYYFNNCTEEHLPELESLAEELELVKTAHGKYKGNHQWDGEKETWQALRHNKGLMHLTYHPSNTNWPLSIQTLSTPVTYRDTRINRVMRRLISITGSTRVSDDQREIIDMSHFLD
jgi:hypothetical protein